MNPSRERRKTNQSVLVPSQYSVKQTEEALRKYGKTKVYLWNAKMLGTLVRGDKGRNRLRTTKNVTEAKLLTFAERVLFSLRAIHREAIGLRNGVKH